MRLPNMSRAVSRWSKKIEVLRAVISTVNFEPQETIFAREIIATVQPAQKQRINPDIINWSLRYILVHSKDEMFIGEFVKHDGVVFKVIDNGDYNRYGYTESVCEEVKNCDVKYQFKN